VLLPAGRAASTPFTNTVVSNMTWPIQHQMDQHISAYGSSGWMFESSRVRKGNAKKKAISS